MLCACPSSAFTWDLATQFPFVVVLGWLLHLKGPRKLESPMIELQPAEQTMLSQIGLFLGFCIPAPLSPLRVILEQSGLTLPVIKEDSLVFIRDMAVKLTSRECYFLFQTSVLMCLYRLSLEILYIMHTHTHITHTHTYIYIKCGNGCSHRLLQHRL